MAGKRFWLRIDPCLPALVLWVGILLVVGRWYAPLWWACRALPKYFAGHVPSPREFTTLWEAETLLEQGAQPERIQPLLEESLRIEPTSRAMLLLGELHLRREKPDAAEPLFRAFRAIDPNEVSVYLRLAELAQRRGSPAEAEAVLRQGMEHFAGVTASHQPVFDPTASFAANSKATKSYRDAALHLNTLSTALQMLIREKPPLSPPIPPLQPLPRQQR